MGKKSRSKRNRAKAASTLSPGEKPSVAAALETPQASTHEGPVPSEVSANTRASENAEVSAKKKLESHEAPPSSTPVEPISVEDSASPTNKEVLQSSPPKAAEAKKDRPKRSRKKSSASIKKDIEAAARAEPGSATVPLPPSVEDSPAISQLEVSPERLESVPKEVPLAEPVIEAEPQRAPAFEPTTAVAPLAPAEPARAFALASPLLRLCAFAYDLIFLLVVNLAIFSFAGFRFIHRFMEPVAETNTFEPQEAKLYFALALAISFVVSWLYFALSESVFGQATIGKRIFYLKTSDLTGAKISFLRSNLRVLGKIVSCATLGIGFMLSLFRRDRRTLHDIIAETQVLKS